MDIFIKRDGQTSGPYAENEIRNLIASKQISETDTGWHDGLSKSIPLSKILLSCPTVAGKSLQTLPKSHLAKESFIVSLICIAAWITAILFTTLVSDEFRADRNKMVLVASLFFLVFASNVAGFVFGIIASTKKVANKRTAIKGIIINGIQILLVAFALIAGQVGK